MGLLVALKFVFLIFAVLSGFTLLAGLYRPWWALWFMDYMNRLLVIKIYGVAVLIFAGLYFGLSEILRIFFEI
ncbi:hypothetical protein FUAX_09060 [Fulvitalea axinellae]|uniref:Uncharacterized protein n=1 Tax=Fulvitalea axinellae TaxID=1182444 RepID=A0AAU9C8Z3_9BACT|nr:hypothetical protein FUAX_09060 [Fulvitalea axinellae]